jgi:hypothetical protein
LAAELRAAADRLAAGRPDPYNLSGRLRALAELLSPC